MESKVQVCAFVNLQLHKDAQVLISWSKRKQLNVSVYMSMKPNSRRWRQCSRLKQVVPTLVKHSHTVIMPAHVHTTPSNDVIPYRGALANHSGGSCSKEEEGEEMKGNKVSVRLNRHSREQAQTTSVLLYSASTQEKDEEKVTACANTKTLHTLSLFLRAPSVDTFNS